MHFLTPEVAVVSISIVGDQEQLDVYASSKKTSSNTIFDVVARS